MLQQIQQFRTLGEDFAMQHTDTQYLGALEEELLTAVLQAAPVEKRLEGLSPEERVRGLSAEERVEGLSLAAGLSLGIMGTAIPPAASPNPVPASRYELPGGVRVS